MRRNIVPDKASVKVPYLSYEDGDALNRLTAYGRPMLEGSSRRCGCFHCGSTFSASEITDWMPEEDGADTALCPYCGYDSVLYDTKEFPVSMALLSGMYEKWFETEYRERKKDATYVPPFSGYGDYQRQGIVFRMEKDPRYELVGEVELWLMGDISDWDWPMDEALDARDPCGTAGEGPYAEDGSEAREEPGEEDDAAGGLLRIVVHVEDGAASEYGFIDERGHVLSYPLWGQRDHLLLREFLEKYASRLMGLLVDPYDSKVRLVVKQEETA